MKEEQVREIIREELQKFLGIGRYTFQKDIQIFDGRNIQTGRTVGTSIGGATDQKVSVYGVTPVVQAGAISDPSGGAVVDSQSRSAIASIIDALQAFGIIA